MYEIGDGSAELQENIDGEGKYVCHCCLNGLYFMFSTELWRLYAGTENKGYWCVEFDAWSKVEFV